MVVTIGSDPEVFVSKGKKIVPGCGKIGGTKREPFFLEEGYYCQEDNVLAEFNIPPASSLEEWVNNIDHGKALLQQRLSKANLSFTVKASHIFKAVDIEPYPKAFEFGCDPDINAWTMGDNVFESHDTLLRTAGGHIHIGGDEIDDPWQLIRAMDLFLGVPSIILDKDSRRKKLYGKAGAFRFQPWGVEYRVLSNFWLNDPVLVKWAYNATRKAIEFHKSNKLETQSYDGKVIQTGINQSNRLLYNYIAERYPINPELYS